MTLPPDFFSPAQCVGWVSFVLGVAAFLQKDDRRLRFLNASQGMVYGLHFIMLGQPPSAASSFISGTRTFLSLKTRSPWVAAVMLILGVGAGAYWIKDWFGCLPVLATLISTPAIFFMRGIRMRLALLVCTTLWIINNVHNGSHGGLALECFVATANSITITRLLCDRRARRLAAARTAQGEPREPVDAQNAA